MKKHNQGKELFESRRKLRTIDESIGKSQWELDSIMLESKRSDRNYG